jgi:hypothetical protein
MPCSVVVRYQHKFTLKTEAAWPSETPVSFHNTTQLQKPDHDIIFTAMKISNLAQNSVLRPL